MTISVSSSSRSSLQSRTSCIREYLGELVQTANVCDVHAVGSTMDSQWRWTKGTVRSWSSDVKRISDCVRGCNTTSGKQYNFCAVTCVCGRTWIRSAANVLSEGFWTELRSRVCVQSFIFVPLRDRRLRSGLYLCHANRRCSCDINSRLRLKTRRSPSSDYFYSEGGRIRAIRISSTI